MWLNPDPVKNGHLLNIGLDDKGKRWRFKEPSYNFDSAAGIKYEVDVTKQEGERVNILSKVSVDKDTDFDMNATYKVALTSYRASGGG